MHTALACRLLPAPFLLLPAACSDSPAEPSCASAQAALNVCASDRIVHGIDVSKYQGVIDWPAVARSGRVFAFARASDGVGYKDPDFARNWREIRGQGLVRGVYQFFRPDEDPVAQAELLLALVEQAGGLLPDDLPPVLDVEVTGKQTPLGLAARVRSWLTFTEQATGKKPIIYTAAFMSTYLGTTFGELPLWVANYGVACPLMPAGWTSWRFWQHSATGQVPGITGDVDLDVFNGDLEELRAFARGGPETVQPVADAGTRDAVTLDAPVPVAVDDPCRP